MVEDVLSVLNFVVEEDDGVAADHLFDVCVGNFGGESHFNDVACDEVGVGASGRFVVEDFVGAVPFGGKEEAAVAMAAEDIVFVEGAVATDVRIGFVDDAEFALTLDADFAIDELHFELRSTAEFDGLVVTPSARVRLAVRVISQSEPSRFQVSADA